MFPCKCLNLNLVHYTVHTACLNTFLQYECYHEEFLSQQSPIWQNLGILNNFLQYKLQPAQADSCWKSSVGKSWWSDDNVCVKRMLKSFSLCFDKTKSLLTYSNMPTPRLLVAQGEQGQRGSSVWFTDFCPTGICASLSLWTWFWLWNITTLTVVCSFLPDRPLLSVSSIP